MILLNYTTPRKKKLLFFAHALEVFSRFYNVMLHQAKFFSLLNMVPKNVSYKKKINALFSIRITCNKQKLFYYVFFNYNIKFFFFEHYYNKISFRFSFFKSN
jgi:hypothetical protein